MNKRLNNILPLEHIMDQEVGTNKTMLDPQIFSSILRNFFVRCLKRFLAEDLIKRENSHGVRDHWQWVKNCALSVSAVCTVYCAVTAY